MTDYPPCACACACNLLPDTTLTDYEHLLLHVPSPQHISDLHSPIPSTLYLWRLCGGVSDSVPSRLLSVVRCTTSLTSTPQLLHMSREIVRFSIHHFSPTRHGLPSAPFPLLVLGRASARSRCIASLPASGVHWHVKRHSENENDHDHVPTHDCTAETLSEARSKVGRHCRP